jgi:hypothetical protein
VVVSVTTELAGIGDVVEVVVGAAAAVVGVMRAASAGGSEVIGCGFASDEVEADSTITGMATTAAAAIMGFKIRAASIDASLKSGSCTSDSSRLTRGSARGRSSRTSHSASA